MLLGEEETGSPCYEVLTLPISSSRPSLLQVDNNSHIPAPSMTLDCTQPPVFFFVELGGN